MKLFFSPTSPYVRKVLLCAHELHLSESIELVVAQVSPIDRNLVVGAQNPLGKIPALITDQGQTLFDSTVICEYLNDLAAGHLFPKSADKKWQALTMQSLGDGLLDAALLARYETFLRPSEFRWNDWTNGQIDKIQAAMKFFEARQNSTTEFHIGYITLACALGYLDLRYEHLQWRSLYPGLKSWYETISKRESMKHIWTP
jgi:glutathione S-transferase